MMIVQATSTRPASRGHAICICSLYRRRYRGLFRAERFTSPSEARTAVNSYRRILMTLPTWR
jgi:hypothetical protein